jgi:hypothetical protein
MTINPEKITFQNTDYIRADLSPASAPPDCTGLDYAIVRSRDQGVMSGYVKAIDGRRVTLLAARQLWRWSSRFVLVDLAEFGPTAKWECKFSAAASKPVEMLEACGVLYCTDVSAAAIRATPAQEPGK